MISNYLGAIYIIDLPVGDTIYDIIANFFIYNVVVFIYYAYAAILNSPLLFVYIGNISNNEMSVDKYYDYVIYLFSFYNYLFVYVGLPIIGQIYDTGCTTTFACINSGLYVAYTASAFVLVTSVIGLIIHGVAKLFAYINLS